MSKTGVMTSLLKKCHVTQTTTSEMKRLGSLCSWWYLLARGKLTSGCGEWGLVTERTEISDWLITRTRQ